MVTLIFSGVVLAGGLTSTANSTDSDRERLLAAAPERETDIVNGVVETGFPATASLAFGTIHVCSASLITPRILLSAAHCGDVTIDALKGLGRVHFGSETAASDVEQRVLDVYVHPDYEPLSEPDAVGFQTLGQYDLALVVMWEEVDIEPVWIRTEPMSENLFVTERPELVSVGFGITGPEANDAGLKRSATLTVDEIDEMWVYSSSETNENEAGICSGDSGGPQYHIREDGSLEQWAVHSWGDERCTTQSGSNRIDIAADWVMDTIEAVHGTRDLCAVNRRYGDGVCDVDCPEPDVDCEVEEPGGLACSVGPAGSLGLLLLLPLLGLRRRD